ncbi:MAG: hypothetical protein JWM82_363, partial [Myxococcales bacterium]|nr:hypothetical protein [Myxococcales bacterium]
RRALGAEATVPSSAPLRATEPVHRTDP